MKQIINLIYFSLSIVIIFLVVKYNNNIIDFLANTLENYNQEIIIKDSNIYKKTKSYGYVQPTYSYIPYSHQDLINIYYTIINNGWKEFTFYCPKEYIECEKQIEDISGNGLILTHINNYVHPFNTFVNIKSSINELGAVTVNVEYLYTEDMINQINSKIDSILPTLQLNGLSNYQKVKKVHDYIINNVDYDIEAKNINEEHHPSYNAYGPLFYHKATCSGYTDLMAIILSRFGIDNYKVATMPNINNNKAGHIWNGVFINGKWLHLDLTWDDPVSNDGTDYLLHKYFLIDNNELENLDNNDKNDENHDYIRLFYPEYN